MSLADLPVELIRQVLDHLTVDDIFALRLSCNRVCQLTDANVDTVSYQVARNTFPRARVLLQRPTTGQYNFKWLKSLIPARLAAIVLDKHTCLPWREPIWNGSVMEPEFLDGFPAECDTRQELRGRVANGWWVLQLISNIYKDVYRLPCPEDPGEKLPWRELGGAPRAPSSETSRCEYAVFFRVISLLTRLQPSDCMDFLLLFYPLVDAFRCTELKECRYNWYRKKKQSTPCSYFFDCTTTPVLDDHEFRHILAGVPTAAGSQSWRHLDKGNTWLTWFIFHEGPHIFWEQWQRRTMKELPEARDDTPDYRTLEAAPELDQNAHWIRKRIRTAWKEKTESQIHVERECSSRIWYALHRRAHKLSTVPPPGYDPLRNPINNGQVIIDALKEAYAHRNEYHHIYKISQSEWDWYQWQQGRIPIDGHAEFDSQELIMFVQFATHAAWPYFARFDSLPDINYYIWL